jgi:RNA polymerase sigma-70 factor (ECF subfamily)
MDEKEAITRLKRGEITGLEALVNRYQQRALRTAYLITQDAALAEDVAQTAFIRAYKSIHQFDIEREFSPWFIRIVANAAVQASRQQQRQIRLDEDLPSIDDLLADSLFHPETEVEMREAETAVQNALLQLSPEQRAVIILRYYADMSEKEMAQALHTQPGTIKSRLNTARSRLRGLLKLKYT